MTYTLHAHICWDLRCWHCTSLGLVSMVMRNLIAYWPTELTLTSRWPRPPSVRHVWSPRQRLHTVTETFSCSHILLRLGCKNDGGLTSLWLSMMTKEQITAVSHPTSSFPLLYAITDVLPSCLGVIFLLEDIGWVNVCAILDGERRTGGGRGWGRATGMAEQYLLSWLHKSAFTIVARKTSHCTQLPSLLLVYRCFLILSFPPPSVTLLPLAHSSPSLVISSLIFSSSLFPVE